ncbi:MAG: hypothetical protein ACLUV3_09295 [Oscillospiraceae bacterium]
MFLTILSISRKILFEISVTACPISSMGYLLNPVRFLGDGCASPGQQR